MRVDPDDHVLRVRGTDVREVVPLVRREKDHVSRVRLARDVLLEHRDVTLREVDDFLVRVAMRKM